MRAVHRMIPLAFAACTWNWDALEPAAPRGAAGPWIATFAEECTGTMVDRSRWNTTFARQETNFRRYDWSMSAVADENVTVTGGLCTIRTENRASGGAPTTSGVLDSSRKFEQQYGFFEARVRVPAGKVFGNAVSLSSLQSWPPQITFMNVRGAETTENRPTVWYDDASGATNDPAFSVTTADLSADFHVYGVDWSPAGMVFYLDGAEIGRITDAGPHVDEPLRFEITTHVGANGTTPPDATTPFPVSMQIDWVRAWRRP